MKVDGDRVRAIFFEALDRPRGAQGDYLDEACGGDDVLRAEVESLLAHHDDAPLVDERDSQAIVAAALASASVQRVGARVEPNPARYRTLEQLGAGGFGVVAKRFDRNLCRIVASKSPIGSDPLQEAALLHEARLLAYLDHPGVVQVYDLREDESGISYTMELLEGESVQRRLADLRADNRRMAVAEAVRIVTRVSETVANAHAKGVLHLDIKPDNVMLQPFGRVSVIDWGMARFHDPEPYRRQLAQAGEVGIDGPLVRGISGGTPAYMPPEQFDPAAKLGPAADVYAIGALLFELLTGRAPFEHGADVTELRAHKQRGAPAVRELRPEVSERLNAICTTMLAPEPADRPSSLTAVLEDLATLSDIGGAGALVRLEPGAVLFEQGAESTTAYQIVTGELEILVDGDIVATRHTGDIVGELAMLSKTLRSATVRARSTTVVRAIDWAALEGELSKADPLIAHLLRELSDKLIQATRGDPPASR